MIGPETPLGGQSMETPKETALEIAERIQREIRAKGMMPIEEVPKVILEAQASVVPVQPPQKPSTPPVLDEKRKSSGERDVDAPEVVPVLDEKGKPTGEYIQKDLFI